MTQPPLFRPHIEAVCDCGFRRPTGFWDDRFREHMREHARLANWHAAQSWHIETDGQPMDRP